MSHKWIDIENVLNSYLDSIGERTVYVGDESLDSKLQLNNLSIQVEKSMNIEEWSQYINLLRDSSKDKIDLLFFDDCLSFENTTEILEYMKKLYMVMNNNSKLVITFRDIDFLMSLSQNTDDRDCVDYIQRHIYYSDDSIRDVFFEKSWEEKARFVAFERLSNVYGNSLFSATVLERILKTVGFDIIKIEKGKSKYIKKSYEIGSWVENLEYKSIVAQKGSSRGIDNIYIVEDDIDSIHSQGGVLDKTLENLCKKNRFKYKFVYLSEKDNEKIYDRCKEYGIDSSYVTSIYHLCTNIKPYPVTYTLHEFLKRFNLKEGSFTINNYNDHIDLLLNNGTICKLSTTDKGYISVAEIYRDSVLMNRMTFTYTLLTEERFSYDGEKICSREKLFFDENGSVSYRYEMIGDACVFYLPDVELHSKEEFFRYVIGNLLNTDDKILCGENEYKIFCDKGYLIGGDKSYGEKNDTINMSNCNFADGVEFIRAVKKVKSVENMEHKKEILSFPLYIPLEMNGSIFDMLESIKNNWFY